MYDDVSFRFNGFPSLSANHSAATIARASDVTSFKVELVYDWSRIEKANKKTPRNNYILFREITTPQNDLNSSTKARKSDRQTK